MQEMEISEVKLYYNEKHFDNPPIEVGNICYIKLCDDEGCFEEMVKVIADRRG